MRICKHLTLAAALLTAAVSQTAQALDTQALYTRAALEQQVAAIAPQIRSAFEASFALVPQPTEESSALRERIQSTIDSAFSTDAGESAMLVELERQLDDTDQARVMAWLDSPIGERILAAEQAAVDSTMVEYEAFLENIDASPPSEHRLKVLSELDDALGSTEAGARLLMQLDLAISVAERGAANEAPLVWQDMTNASIPSLSAYAEAVEEHVFRHHMFAFRDLSTRELKQYIAFATSKSGARFVLAVQRGLERALSNGTWQLAELLIRWQKSPEMIEAKQSF